jgi:hypothetical protein
VKDNNNIIKTRHKCTKEQQGRRQGQREQAQDQHQQQE